MVRRSEEDEVPQLRHPPLTRSGRHVTSAPRNEPAHAVGDDGHFLDRHGPLLDEALEQRGERAAVRRDVQPAVVVQVDRRVSEVAGEGGSVVVSLPGPTQIRHRRAVDEDEELAARFWEARG